jgi:hypothetical protein
MAKPETTNKMAASAMSNPKLFVLRPAPVGATGTGDEEPANRFSPSSLGRDRSWGGGLLLWDRALSRLSAKTWSSETRS